MNVVCYTFVGKENTGMELRSLLPVLWSLRKHPTFSFLSVDFLDREYLYTYSCDVIPRSSCTGGLSVYYYRI